MKRWIFVTVLLGMLCATGTAIVALTRPDPPPELCRDAALWIRSGESTTSQTCPFGGQHIEILKSEDGSAHALCRCPGEQKGPTPQ